MSMEIIIFLCSLLRRGEHDSVLLVNETYFGEGSLGILEMKKKKYIQGCASFLTPPCILHLYEVVRENTIPGAGAALL